ncbi:MAG: response regulator transcription factor [Anaerolineae bacterium]|nr:response regulator transcription factor [Anaerolineae bacterium]
MQNSIMIVEDHSAVRASLHAWLEMSFPQYRIIEATNGRQAVESVLHTSPQLVLMDLSLPFLNGIEATRQIKALAPETIVVILTIYEGEHYRADAFDVGASAYILKRKMHSELIPTLSELIGTHLTV